MNTKDIRPVLRTGMLAVAAIHTAGYIPCRVLDIRRNVFVHSGESAPDCNGAPSSMQMVTVKLTATRGPWKRGETHETWGLRVAPRAAYHPTRMGARIGYYTVECDK